MFKIYSNIANNLKGPVLWLYFIRFSAIFLQSVSLFLIAALVGIEDFGKFSFLFSSSQVISVIVAFGGSQYLLRILPTRDVIYESGGNYNVILKCFFRPIAITLFICLGWHVLVSYIHLELVVQYKDEFLLIVIASLLLALLQNFISIVRVTGSANSSLLLREFYPYFFLVILTLITVYFNYLSALSLMIMFCISLFVCICMALYYSFDYLIKCRSIIDNSHDVGRDEHLSFWGSSIIGILYSQVDILLTKLFFGDVAVGIYALLRRVTNLISLPQVIANWTIVVSVAKDFSLNNINSLRESAKRGAWIAFPAAVLMTIILSLLLPIWFGIFGIELNINYIFIFIILSIAQLFNVFAGSNLLFAAQCKEEKYVLRTRITSLLIGVIIMLMGGLYFDMKAIAIGAAVAIILLNYMVLMHVKRVLGIWTSISLRGMS